MAQSSRNADQTKKVVKTDEAQKLCGGVIVEVTSKLQAEMAANAGACGVLVTCRPVPGCVNRTPDPATIREIMQSVKIPVMVRVRVGHFIEARLFESIGVDFIDESEVLSVADENHFILKNRFSVPFVSGCRDLGELFRRVSEGATVIRTQGDITSSGDVMETVSTVRRVMAELNVLINMDSDEVFAFSRKIKAPYLLVAEAKQTKRLPVPHFAAGGIFTPADAVLMRKLGCDGVFVGLEVFDHVNPVKLIKAIVKAVTRYNDPVVIAEVTSGLVKKDSRQGSALEDAVARLNIQETGDSGRHGKAVGSSRPHEAVGSSGPREAVGSSRPREAEDSSRAEGSTRPREADGSIILGNSEMDHRVVD